MSPTPPVKRRFPFVLFAVLLALDVAAMLLEKQSAVSTDLTSIRSLATQPCLWAIFAVKFAQLFVWTRILSTVDISLAFPLTSLSYPATMLAAVLLLKEHLGWQIWLGGILITVGCAVLGGAGHGQDADAGRSRLAPAETTVGMP